MRLATLTRSLDYGVGYGVHEKTKEYKYNTWLLPSDTIYRYDIKLFSDFQFGEYSLLNIQHIIVGVNELNATPSCLAHTKYIFTQVIHPRTLQYIYLNRSILLQQRTALMAH